MMIPRSQISLELVNALYVIPDVAGNLNQHIYETLRTSIYEESCLLEDTLYVRIMSELNRFADSYEEA